jgi:glycosyltransferase involved in cell wall biosynthesis
MENTPRVSVLMSAYNAEKYIAEAINSILNQTFSDFEFIIVNDGSTDATAEIVRSYTDPRIVFVDNKENQRLVAALNQGMDMCRGEYVARMDADDVSLPERFEKQVRFLDANPEIGILGTNYRIFGASSGTSKQKENIGCIDILKGWSIWQPTAMLRKSVFDKYNLRYSLEFTVSEDYELWSRAARYTKRANLPEVLLRYRWHDANLSVKQRALEQENGLRAKKNLLNFLCGTEETKIILGTQFGIYDAQKYIRLFGFIPLLRIKSTENKQYVYLFHFLPLIKIKRQTIFLFHLNFLKIATVSGTIVDPRNR